jgi:hypothetical protein
VLLGTFFISTVLQIKLREEHGLREFENRVSRIFGPKRKEVGSWIRLHNEELHSVYPPNIVRVVYSVRMMWARYLSRMSEGRGVYRVLVGSSLSNSRLGRRGIGGRITLRCTLRMLVSM